MGLGRGVGGRAARRRSRPSRAATARRRRAGSRRGRRCRWGGTSTTRLRAGRGAGRGWGWGRQRGSSQPEAARQRAQQPAVSLAVVWRMLCPKPSTVSATPWHAGGAPLAEVAAPTVVAAASMGSRRSRGATVVRNPTWAFIAQQQGSWTQLTGQGCRNGQQTPASTSRHPTAASPLRASPHALRQDQRLAVLRWSTFVHVGR